VKTSDPLDSANETTLSAIVLHRYSSPRALQRRSPYRTDSTLPPWPLSKKSTPTIDTAQEYPSSNRCVQMSIPWFSQRLLWMLNFML